MYLRAISRFHSLSLVLLPKKIMFVCYNNEGENLEDRVLHENFNNGKFNFRYEYVMCIIMVSNIEIVCQLKFIKKKHICCHHHKSIHMYLYNTYYIFIENSRFIEFFFFALQPYISKFFCFAQNTADFICARNALARKRKTRKKRVFFTYIYTLY